MTVHLSYLETYFEHPTRRHIFANTVGRVSKLDLTLRRSPKLDPVGSTVRYEMMKLCTGSV